MRAPLIATMPSVASHLPEWDIWSRVVLLDGRPTLPHHSLYLSAARFQHVGNLIEFMVKGKLQMLLCY
jgi:hypothetical protein